MTGPAALGYGELGGGLSLGTPILLVLVAMLCLLVFGHLRSKAHRKRLLAWARENGWTWVGTDKALLRRWNGAPFDVGHSRQASDVLAGVVDGRTGISFTLTYRTGSGKNQSTHNVHVVCVALPTVLRNLTLTPEHLGTRIARAFGGQDLQFESEAFNRAWHVQADNPRFAHDVLHPRMLARLLEPDAVGVNVRIVLDTVVTWTDGVTDVDRILPRTRLIRDVIAGVPTFVWQDHGYDPGRAS